MEERQTNKVKKKDRKSFQSERQRDTETEIVRDRQTARQRKKKK